MRKSAGENRKLLKFFLTAASISQDRNNLGFESKYENRKRRLSDKNLTAVVYNSKLHLNSQAVGVNQWRLPVNAPTLNAGISIAGDFDNCLYNCSALKPGSSPEVITGLRSSSGAKLRIDHMITYM